MDKKQFIEDLFKRRSIYNDPDQAEMALHMLSKLSTDIYSENKRFVFEFIQNADDSSLNGSNEVLFDFLDDCLIVSHNGKKFDQGDIASITHAGSSTKTSDSTKTGYKGVGFKSVFGKSKRVTIFSDGYQFRFDKGFHSSLILPWQVIPIWTDIKDLPVSAQRSLETLTYSVATIIELPDSKQLEKELKELLSNGEILLFLRRVSKITVKRNNILQSEITKVVTETDNAYIKTELRLDNKLVSTWLLKTFEHIQISDKTKTALKSDDDAPPKLKNSEFTDLSFAAKLIGDKIVSLPRNESLIFTYLPTKVREYDFPFLVNASFLTNTPREALHEDQIWNIWLFEMAGKLLLRWLEELASTNYRFQTLNLLPSTSSSSIGGLRRIFENEVRSLISKCRFIVDLEGKVRTLEKSVWDQTGLSEQSFIERKFISRYINAERNLNVEENGFIHKHFEKLEKLHSFGVITFELAELDKFFGSSFFSKNHKVEQNFGLIRYFKMRADGDSDGMWFFKLKTMPFIFNESGILANPSTGICFPTLAATTELGKIPLIHKEVYESIEKNKDVFDWLRALGVKEPSELAYVTNVIIPNLENPSFVTDANHIQIVTYLLRLFQNNELTEEMLSQLRALRIKTKRTDEAIFTKAHDCYLSDKYNPYTKLESNIPGLNYISEEYLTTGFGELRLASFFKAINVKDRIEIETVDWLTIPEVRRITSDEWVNEAKNRARSSGGFGFGDHNIIRNIKLPSFLQSVAKNYLFAEQFWENILLNKESLAELSTHAVFVYGEGRGENRHSVIIESYFKWFIQNETCIPVTSEILVKPQEAFASTKEIKQLAGKHLPVFTYENPLSHDWKKFLGLKETLGLEDYLSILENISIKVLDGEEPKRAEIKRIGNLYEKLASLLPEYAEDKKDIIREWASSHRIFSDSQTFEYPSELMYINIPGFIGTDSLKLIHLPSGHDFNNGNYRELFELFSVKIIDNFVPRYQNAREDYQLKNHLLDILPYYAKLAAIREATSLKEEFSRMFEILSSLKILNADKINLAFTHLDEEILGPDRPSYQSGAEFCYIGDRGNPITKFSIIPQLYKLFGITGLNEEFRLLFEIDENATQKWFNSINIDIKEILESPEYKKSKIKFRPKVGITQPKKPLNTVEAESTNGSGLEMAPTFEPNLISDIPRQTFVPKVSPNKASFSKVSFYQSSPSTNSEEYLAPSTEDIDEQSKVDIGRWAEKYVFLYLKNKYNKVNWSNENGESYKPFDFIVFGENNMEIFIEVKGTPSSTKTVFPISIEEWKLMFEKGDNYYIYRVFSAGNEEPDIRIIKNPAKELVEGNILPYPLNLKI
ncbi:MAG: DUF3883 domain-containing protein [Bacteroidetes bacterium]|nr:DUF3883 domain-containing protein [Bacteroidota bacterium]